MTTCYVSLVLRWLREWIDASAYLAHSILRGLSGCHEARRPDKPLGILAPFRWERRAA